MMLHKIFHMNQSVSETKRRLANVGSYRHHLDGVEKADLAGNGMSHWSLALPLGFRADLVLTEVASEQPDTLVFKSVEGDLEIMGMVSFHAIKNNLTEVDVVINYESASPMFRLLDRMLSIGDHFFINQLRRVRAHFEGIATPAPQLASVYSGAMKPAHA